MIQYPAIINPTQTEVRSISTKFIQQDYRLFVSLPETYAESDEKYPVLYLLDGNSTFTLAKPIVELQQFAQHMPELIIVGVGYPTKTYIDTVTLRGRDLTFVEMTPEEKAATGYPFEETGKASLFFSFLLQELIPFIDSEYRTDPSERALVGISLSATFALYAMFQKPVAFNRMIAVSPSFDHIFPVEEQFSREHHALPLKLFVGIEAPENFPGALERVESAKQFIELLENRNYEGLKTILRVFEGLDHLSVNTIGLTYALREIYGSA